MRGCKGGLKDSQGSFHPGTSALCYGPKQNKKKFECMPRKTAGQPSPSAHTIFFQVQQGRPRSVRLQIQCRKTGSHPVLALLDSHQPARASNHAPRAKLAADPCHSRCRPAPRVRPAVHCPTSGRSCLHFILVLWGLLCFQRERLQVCKRVFKASQLRATFQQQMCPWGICFHDAQQC